MWGRRCLRTSVRRNERGVQLRLNRQLWKRTRDERMSALTPSTTRQSVRYFGSVPGRREGAKLTNGTEVEEEWQFSAAGQAGVGLAQLIEESMCAGLQRRQPRHWCIFQQSGTESDGLRWGTRLKYLTGQGANREKSMLSGTFGPTCIKCSTCSNAQQLQLCSPLLHQV